jgi:Fe-S cluster assembly ATP-binding protein
MAFLELKDLHVAAEGKEIVKGISLALDRGEVHALMGPNGSGKSTLAFALMGNPTYTITKGTVSLNGEDVTALSPDKRAQKGLFLSFQYPSEISGVSVSNFLRTAYNSLKHKELNVLEFNKHLHEKMELLKIDQYFATRYLNEGFSGGEKKQTEILQMAVLEPKIAILDETDSGIDVDALKTIAHGINTITKNLNMGILLITHYNRILQYIHVGKVHIMKAGSIIKSGGKDLADTIEKEGYEDIN